ncbi:hypothetical protein CYMTET_25385, partial [Cymbomonas tetramitiformis]
ETLRTADDKEADDNKQPRELFLTEWVVNPFSPWIDLWEWFVRVVITYNFIMIPIQISFPKIRTSKDTDQIVILEAVVDAILIVNMMIMFNMAYVNKRSQLVTNRSKISRHYFATTFTLDVVTSIPFDWIGVLLGVSGENTTYLRLPKLVRMTKIYRYIRTMLASDNTMQGAMLRHTFFIVAILHVAGCLWFFIGANTSDSWYQPDTPEDERTYYFPPYGMREDSTWAQQYLLSVYWVTVTLSTYGVVSEMLPSNLTEILFTIVLMFMNMTLFAYVLGEISNLVKDSDLKLVQKRDERAAVEQFLSGKNFPAHLQNAIRLACTTSDKALAFNIPDAFSHLSYPLRVSVAHHICSGVLYEVPIFQNCSRGLLSALTVIIDEGTYAPGEYLYHLGEYCWDMSMIVRGTVELFLPGANGEEMDSQRIERGSSCGDLAFFFDTRHVTSARVDKADSVSVLKLPRTGFKEILKLFSKEKERIMMNALTGFDKTKSRYSKSEAGESKHDGESEYAESKFDEIMGKGINQIVTVLRRRLYNAKAEIACSLAARGDVEGLMGLLLSAADEGSAMGFGVNHATLRDQRTPLHLACSEGQLEAVKKLIALGADTSATDRHGNTALSDAMRGKHDAVAEVLRKHNPQMKPPLTGCGAALKLCQAAYEGNIDEIKRCVTNNMDVNAADYDERTAIHLAACEGHAAVVEYLLEQGADPLATDRFNGTAMHDAVRHQQWSCMRILREVSGSSLVDLDRAVQLCEVCAVGDLKMLEMLLLAGVDPNLKDYDGRTALHLAACNEQISVIHKLLGFDPRGVGEKGGEGGEKKGEGEKSLADSAALKVDLNPVDKMGFTPLDDAVREGAQVAELMLTLAGAKRSSSPEIASRIEDSKRHAKAELRATLMPQAARELSASTTSTSDKASEAKFR